MPRETIIKITKADLIEETEIHGELREGIISFGKHVLPKKDEVA